MINDSLDVEKLDQFFRGDFPEGDREYFRKVICDKTKEVELEHILKKQWYELLKDNQTEDKNLDHLLYRIHYELNTKRQGLESKVSVRRILHWSIRIAAILFLPLLIYTGIQFYTGKGTNDPAVVEINAPAWTRVQFSLPDGSTGWLNSSSSLRYKSNFIRSREIFLNGEAYFNVAKNVNLPLVVDAGNINIKATGT